ncbi:hypothetical protein LIER_27707 [Lithospermum erythrorhizon]|uniref:Uncharacterized protein n=1 Tax=Lithospermum erythrorhizon TaxID=34254 RepID=A0AAV3RIY0_LITER
MGSRQSFLYWASPIRLLGISPFPTNGWSSTNPSVVGEFRVPPTRSDACVRGNIPRGSLASSLIPPFSGGVLGSFRSASVKGKEEGDYTMSSHPIDLTSEHTDSQNYARDTPANQGLVDESQIETSTEVSLHEEIEAASETIQTAAVGLVQKKKKKRSLVRGVKFASPSEATPSGLASGSKGKEKEAEILLAVKDAFLPNAVPLEGLRGKRPIAFKKVNVVKKAVALPGLSAGVTPSQPSSPLSAEPVSYLQPNLLTRSSSPSLVEKRPAEKRPAEKRPSEGVALQGKDKRVRTSPEHVDLPKSGIPPPFPDHDPLIAPGFVTSEFLEKPYILPGGQQICEGTSFESNLQSFHAMRYLLMEGLCEGYVGNAGFELARRANSLDFENQRLLAQVPSEKEASLEEELAKVREDLAKSQRINSLIHTEKRKLKEDYLRLHKKYEDVTAECKKLKDESSGFDRQITQICGIRDAALAEASCAREEVRELKEESTLLASVEEFKESREFEAALSVAVKHFKKSSEFLDALGANSTYGAFRFVKNDEEDEQDVTPAGDAPSPA